MQSSPTAERATEVLGEDLGSWVLRLRADERSWVWIARRLYKETDGEIELSGERLRQLYAPEQEARSA